MASSRVLLQSLSEKRHPNRMKRMTKAELINYIETIDAAKYARQRNYTGGSTRLSEYISRGMISLPEVRDIILEHNTPSSAWKLINELSWREYWQLVWQIRGDGIFEYIRPLTSEIRLGIPEAVIDATTGIAALDSGIRQLIDTGYIDNHMRMWLAGLICNVAHCDWKIGADWMHSYLVDGDYASNHLSWQWVAGSYTGKPYLPQQENINKYTKTTQRDTYLDKTYSQIAAMPVPGELSEIVTRLPDQTAVLPASTITHDELADAPEILLYSPWTLDPSWRQRSAAYRVLLLDTNMFGDHHFNQNVIDSILWFAKQIPDMKILFDTPQALAAVSGSIIRKSYAGIKSWPGIVDQPDLLYPAVKPLFYPSFSAFWKAIKNS